MVSKGPEVAQAVAELQELTFEPLPIAMLLKVVKSLPLLQQGLRDGACDELFALTKQRVQEVWCWVKGADPEPAILKECSALLAEATLLYPLDAGMQKDFYACGEAITKSSSEALMQEVTHSCLDVASCDKKSLEAMQQVVTACETNLSRIGEAGSAVKDESSKIMLSAQEALLAWASEAPWSDETVQTILASSCAVCTKIGKLRKCSNTEKQVTFMEAGMSLVKAIGAASGAASEGPGSHGELLRKTVEMQRQLMVMSPLVKDPVMSDHPCKGLVLKYVKEGEAKLGAHTLSLVSQSKGRVREKLEVLRPIAGGMETGGHWLDGIAKTDSFEKVLNRYKETMDQCKDKKQLVTAITSMEQVWVRSENLKL